MGQNKVLIETACWVEKFVVQHDICPFASKVVTEKTIHYEIIEHENIEDILEQVMQECFRLMQRKDIETSLLIFPTFFQKFEDYLEGLRLAELLMEEFGFIGTFQLASFHPDYKFDGIEAEDASNYTNRSPYPMMHLIREESLEKAVANYPNPDNIPIRNIAYTRELGVQKIKSILNSCNKL